MSKALLKYVRVSPIKARLVASEIKNMNAEFALATLQFSVNKASRIIYKVIASAVANGNHEASDVIIKSCIVNSGPVLKRMIPKARGRGAPIRKPTSHIFVEVVEESMYNKNKDA